MDSKSDIRLYAKNIRKTLDMKAKSEKIAKNIRKLECYKSAKNVMIFYPLEYEVDLLQLLEDDKNFYLPKVQGDNLVVCPYSDELTQSDLNIQEPCSAPVRPEILDLIVVPALATDFEKYRLGYGKGFYDRFLAQYPNIKTITPIPNELIMKKLPHEKYDVAISEIVTD